MKKKYDHNPRPHKSPSTGSQATASAAPPKATAGALRWYYEYERPQFLPVKPPEDWNEEKDKNGYIAHWGRSADYWRDTAVLMKNKVGEVHAVLERGITHFASEGEAPLLVSLSKLGLREKVALFTELLPTSANCDDTLRLSMPLARILWLESERERITQRQDIHRWLFPFYHVAGLLGDAACDLRESL